MTTTRRKTDLSTLEAIIVEHTLGVGTCADGQTTALARIHLLTRERAQLYAHSSAHPFSAPRNAQRIRAINAEIEALWEELRRERAQRRAQIERALNVTAEDEEPASLEDIFDDEPTPRPRRASAPRRTVRATVKTSAARDSEAEDVVVTPQASAGDRTVPTRKAPRKASSARKPVLPAPVAADAQAEVAGVA